jgi:hypothetical protein
MKELHSLHWGKQAVVFLWLLNSKGRVTVTKKTNIVS